MGLLLDHVVCARQPHQGPCGEKFRMRKIKSAFRQQDAFLSAQVVRFVHVSQRLGKNV